MDDLVTLEAYADENRALIHNGRNDEAIAICKHILHYYPKHIDSYRQMGEAHLEKDELDPAVDLFRRVLSADPENVIAYVGLATAFEQQHLIDEAVWHLERADELEPGNFEIHKELLRLYSEAGKPRQRLKLSPGGLARLYDQEGLYSQAIQELRGIVDESPSRYDARTALAETLWHAGRIRESAEIAQNILTALPYCLKANLILGTAWKESGLTDYETYLNRAQELDPSHKMAHRLLGAHSPLSVTQVTVPRFVQGAPPPPMPRSVSALATQATTEPIKPLEEEPATPSTAFFAETLTVERETAGSPPLESETERTLKPNLPGANLPPWLVSQFPGSSETAAPTRTPAATTNLLGEPDTAAPESAEDELPPWLTGESSAQPSESTVAESPQAESEQLPTWLDNSSGEAGAISTADEQSQASEPTSEEDVPDWLRTLQAQDAPATQPQPAPIEEPGKSEDYVLPSFLAPETQEAKTTGEPASQNFLLPSGQERETAAEPPAPDLIPLSSQPAPTLEEYSSSDQTVEKQPEGPAKAPPAPSIVVELPAALPAPSESAPQIAAEVPSAAPTVAPTSKRKRQPKGHAHLVLAREHRERGRTNDTLAEYDYLVLHAPRLVNDVIADLESLITEADAPLEAHRILGDAYTRADRLSEALQRYQYVLERTSN